MTPARAARAAAIACLAFVASLATGALPARGGGTSVDLDQWATLSAQWQNGDLNGNNARYPEGGAVPFRLAIEGLAAGAHTITISYDFTASGHKAYDFLATWNATDHPGLCQPSGGAISSMCPHLPAASSFTFPSDPFVANKLTVRGAQAWSGAPRQLTIYGGTVTSIGGPVHAGSVDGNSTGAFTVHFRSTGAAVLLAWGGHLAQSSYWDVVAGGARDGASMVSGAPWHMRTLNLDGGGARNQDRSIQPSAIVGELPPSALAPTPTPGAPRAATPAPAPGAQAGGGSEATVPPTEAIAPASRSDDGGIALVGLLVIVGAGAVGLGVPPRRARRSSRR